MAGQMTMDELFGDKINSFGEPHLACALLLDISDSMGGEGIQKLNEGIKIFKENVCADKIARQRVDVALITFDSDVTLVSDFVPVTQMPTPELQAGGRTEMAGAIRVAIDIVKERTRMYQKLGTPCHKPWIFMITDGISTSGSAAMNEAAERIRQEEEKGSHGRLTFWALGVAEYDSEELFRLTDRVIELRDMDFTTIFDWLSESMASISQSQVGEAVHFEPLPENARKAEKDRAIGEGWY